jgi:hypothetical protein
MLVLIRWNCTVATCTVAQESRQHSRKGLAGGVQVEHLAAGTQAFNHKLRYRRAVSAHSIGLWREGAGGGKAQAEIEEAADDL